MSRPISLSLHSIPLLLSLLPLLYRAISLSLSLSTPLHPSFLSLDLFRFLPFLSDSKNWSMTHPDEEYSHMKALKRHNDMLGFVADAQYGIPTKCPCGGGIIPEVSPCNKFPNDFDTQPGRRYFTCKNFEVIFMLCKTGKTCITRTC